jgi:hypothetical protein
MHLEVIQNHTDRLSVRIRITNQLFHAVGKVLQSMLTGHSDVALTMHLFKEHMHISHSIASILVINPLLLTRLGKKTVLCLVNQCPTPFIITNLWSQGIL